MEQNSNRRNFLMKGLTGIGGVVAATHFIPKALAADTCTITPPQTKGPFYPGERAFGLDTDLTQLPGSSKRALGQVVYIRGVVLDQNCRPLAGANVEIWQACHTGRYNSKIDPNPAALDPNFKYWAETFTNAKGEYMFKSIIPGAYPAEPGWVRPPHVHFKVSKTGFKELVTQMYFKGDSLNDRDYILKDLEQAERENVIVDFRPSPAGFEPGSLTGDFTITLLQVKR